MTPWLLEKAGYALLRRLIEQYMSGGSGTMTSQVPNVAGSNVKMVGRYTNLACLA